MSPPKRHHFARLGPTPRSWWRRLFGVKSKRRRITVEDWGWEDLLDDGPPITKEFVEQYSQNVLALAKELPAARKKKAAP